MKRLNVTNLYHNGYIIYCNGHSPTDTRSVRLGVACGGYVTAVAAGQSQAKGFILVWESLTGIILVLILPQFHSQGTSHDVRG
jgi:hypothetical protein